MSENNFDLKNLAKIQRFIFLSIVAQVIIIILSGVLLPAKLAPSLSLALGIAVIYFVWNVCKAMNFSQGKSIVFCVLQLIAGLNIITLAYLLYTSYTVLKSAGIKVGYLGVAPEDIEKL